MDICDKASIHTECRVCRGRGRSYRLLVNSVGMTLLGATEETSIAEAQALFDTNVFDTLRVGDTGERAQSSGARGCRRDHRRWST